MSAKYILKVRSMTRPTLIKDWGGWRRSTAWTKWATIAKFATYTEALGALQSSPTVGLRQYAVFYNGKPYKESRNSRGDLLETLTGADAL